MTNRTSRRTSSAATPSVRRKSRRTERAPKVNDAVEIWWSVDKTFYRGTLTRKHSEDTYRVVYDDGEMEDLNLTKEFWRFSDDSNGSTNRPSAGGEDIVEVVLDGSDEGIGDNGKGKKKEKEKKKEERSKKTPKKETPVADKNDKTPAKDRVAGGSESKKSPTGDAALLETRSSTDNITKTKPKQKFSKSRKDAIASDKSAQKSKTTTAKLPGEGASREHSASQGKPSAERPKEKPVSLAKSTHRGATSGKEPLAANLVESGGKKKNNDVVQPVKTVGNGRHSKQKPDSNSSELHKSAHDRGLMPKSGRATPTKGTPTKSITKPKKHGYRSIPKELLPAKVPKGIPGDTSKGDDVLLPVNSKARPGQKTKPEASPPVSSKARPVPKAKPVGVVSAGAGARGTNKVLGDSGGSDGKNAGGPSADVTVRMDVVNKEDSIRSKSSTEKEAASFAADRKRKKKRMSEPVPSLSPTGNAEKKIKSGAVVTKEVAPRRNSISGKISGDHNKATTSAAEKSAGSTPGASAGKAPISAMKRTTAISVGSSGTEPRRVAPIAPSRPNKMQGRTPIAPKPTPPASQGQKRDRAEVGSDSANALRSAVESESNPKRLRVQPSGPPQASGLVPSASPAMYIPEPAKVMDSKQLQLLLRNAMAPSSAVIEVVKENVKQLSELVRSGKEETKCHKDVIHRRVIDESNNVRRLIRDFKNGMLQEIDKRAKETERRMTETMERLIREAMVAVRANALQPGVPRLTEPRTMAPSSSGNYETPQLPSQQRARANNATQGAPVVMPTQTASGRNDSPTAIANVEQEDQVPAACDINEEMRDITKEGDETGAADALRARVSHLVARQITVWLLETPHEYAHGEIKAWAREVAAVAFSSVSDQLTRFHSYMQAYHTLCSSLGNDSVELQWFVSPGIQEHLDRARQNYAAWDPPPTDEEWRAEMTLLKELAERYSRALQTSDMGDMTDMQACVQISKLAARDEYSHWDGATVRGTYEATNGSHVTSSRPRQ